MERIIRVVGNSAVSVQPEILLYYAAFAVLTTVFVNWALGTLLIMLKPFTCAAIMIAFIRPDLVEKFIQEENLLIISEKLKIWFVGFINLLLKFGGQFHARVN